MSKGYKDKIEDIIHAKNDGLSNRAIARIHEVSPQTIGAWLDKYYEDKYYDTLPKETPEYAKEFDEAVSDIVERDKVERKKKVKDRHEEEYQFLLAVSRPVSNANNDLVALTCSSEKKEIINTILMLKRAIRDMAIANVRLIDELLARGV